MRPNTPFTLPNGDIAVLNQYITFGEKTALRGIYLKENDDNRAVIDKEIQDFSFKSVIVSLTGKDGVVVTDVLSYIANLPAEDGVALLVKVNEIVIGKKTQ